MAVAVAVAVARDHHTVHSLLRNGAIVRSLLSFEVAYTAEWSFTVAIALVAFEDGGALGHGVLLATFAKS